MAFTQNSSATFVKQPRTWTASIGNGDASAWKILYTTTHTADPTTGGAGANGSKISTIGAISSDTSNRVVQLAILRQQTVTISNASPGVVTLTGHNLVAGDQVIFGTSSGGGLPTGLTAGTTYFVISGGLTANTSFEVSASAGGSAVNTSSAGSGTFYCYTIRLIGSLNIITLAGTDGATAQQNFYNSSLISLPPDNDGNPYVFLESGDFLGVSCTGTVTSNKIINIIASGGDF